MASGSWMIEDDEGLLPVGPFETWQDARDCCTEIECGRPVFVPEEKQPDYRSAPEPQEMTSAWVAGMERSA